MSTVTWPLAKLRRASACVVCGQRADRRVDAVVSDHVHVEDPTFPMCAAHAQQDASRWVAATGVTLLTKVGPIVAAYLAGRQLDAPMAAAIAVGLAAAAVGFGLDRALMPRLTPLARIVARTGDDVTLAVIGTPPTDALDGGPPPRAGRRLLDRTRPQPWAWALVAVTTSIIAGWQWSQARPVLWLDNPTATDATFAFATETRVVPAGGSDAIRLRIGRHRVTVTGGDQTLELPIEVRWGQAMLLAAEPGCYALPVPLATTMAAEGQLFDLASSEWRRIACSD